MLSYYKNIIFHKQDMNTITTLFREKNNIRSFSIQIIIY